MKVYVFGNQDLPEDNAAILTAGKLTGLPGIEFETVKPNEDLPFVDEPDVVIIDTVQGINEITIMGNQDIDKLIVPKSVTVHDFDLGFQLKLLLKLGKLKQITIIGLPQNKKPDYERIQSILRKLVEQDMQGS